MELDQVKKRVYQSVNILLILGCVLAGVKIVSELRAFKFIGAGVNTVASITVEGSGEQTAVPDTAEITIGVVAEAKDSKAAVSQAATTGNKVVDYLKKAGIAQKDIKTQNYSLYPQYSGSQPCYGGVCPVTRPTIIGYEVRQSFQVKIRDLDKAGEIVSGATAAGATEVSGPIFKVDDEDAVRNAARAEAIGKAQAKAARLADDLGVSLVRVISFNDTGNPVYYPMTAKAQSMGGEMDMAAPAPSLPAGENKITANVSITYEIR